jgi:hypothetical protein
MPLYWTPRENGQAHIWPVPNRDYTLRARDIGGRDPEAVRKPATLAPVAEMIVASNRAMEEAARRSAPTVEYETFGRRGVPGVEE